MTCMAAASAVSAANPLVTYWTLDSKHVTDDFREFLRRVLLHEGTAPIHTLGNSPATPTPRGRRRPNPPAASGPPCSFV